MKLRFSNFIYATTAAVGALTVGVITGSTIQEGPHDPTDSQYECGRRQNVTSITERIINGTNASIEHWPWMVGIYDSCDNLICGGSLINNEHVVTAAHCFGNQSGEKFYARLGTEHRFNFSCNETRQYFNVQKKTANEKSENQDLGEQDASRYEASETQEVCVEIESICTPIQETCGLFMSDIAVVKLKRSVNFTDYIQPICIPDNCADLPATFTAHVAGWGNTYDSFYEYEEYEDYNETEEETSEEEDEEAMDKKISDDLSSAISEIPELPKCIIPNFGLPENLRQREVDVLNQDQCTDQINCAVPDHIVCVNGGSCHGDSGGPLMYEKNGLWFLGGVVSDGPEDCIHPPKPTLFVKVSHFVNSLISPAMNSGSEKSRNATCATEQDRKKCVAEFYKAHNRTVGYSSRIDAPAAYKRRL